MPSDAEEVWAETTDGDLLRQMFGDYPTLHDAKITEVRCDLGRRTLHVELDYQDEGEDGRGIEVQIGLTWTEVRRANLPLEELDVLHVDFRLKGELIETWFDTAEGQFSVVAGGFDAEIRRDRPKEPPRRLVVG